MKSRTQHPNSKRLDVVVASLVLLGGLAWLGRGLIHLIGHREWTFLSEAIGASLMIALGVLLFHGILHPQKPTRARVRFGKRRRSWPLY